MIRRPLLVALVLTTLAPLLVAAALPDDRTAAGGALDAVTALDAPTARAGVASVDASWHLGASGGQFSDTEPPFSEDFVDPHAHSTKKRPTDEIGSRILTRALVVEGVDGQRVAVVANDLYLPNDLLNRRVASLLEDHDRNVSLGLVEGPVTGIGEGNLAVTVSHNHNSPFYSTPGWGTWIFQDVFDVRFYDYYAQRMAEAVIAAAGELRPVRMGAATVPFNEITSHTYGPKVADDGTPAGQPYSHTTGLLSVVRFDDVTDPANPVPYANWVVLGVHPEWTWGYDVFNGDITHATMRIIDRELGTTTVMSQRETGSSGPHKDTRVHAPEERREFQDNGLEQLDHGARLWADAVIGAFEAIETQPDTAPYDPANPRTDGPPVSLVPFDDAFTVDVASMRFAPPTGRPVPGISNCNTAQLFHGNPQAPVLGFPDCTSSPEDPVGLVEVPLDEAGRAVVEATPVDEAALYEDLKAAGVPIPDTYTATAFTAVEETAAVHVMAMRLGELGVTFCPCEQFTDTALNVQTRLDRIADNVWRGWDWLSQTTPAGRDWCVDNGDGTSTCADPRDPNRDLPAVETADVERMLAQINNDAAGWETDAGSLFGEAEAWDPADIFGNFTHAEVPAERGYAMAISVGMANDYFGYVPNYREMRAHDHYRKALNGLGPHGADYLATRMVALAGSLNGGPSVVPSPQDLAYQAESARASALSRTLGEIAANHYEVYDTALPPDGGSPAITSQPADVRRFDAAHVSWVGGSNWTDMPQVAVQRLEDGDWATVGDQHGEVQARVGFPTPADLPAVEAGTFEWVWTSSFEAFASDLALPEVDGDRVTATPPGTYRFVIDGRHRAGVADVREYHLASEPFEVGVWDGITVDLSIPAKHTVEARVGPTTTGTWGGTDYTFGPIDYPDTYDSPLGFVSGAKERFTYGLSDPARHQFYCRFCRFRPWTDTGDAERVVLTVSRPGGPDRRIEATRVAPGVFRAEVVLGANDVVRVLPGDVTDRFGNVNGAAASATR